MPTSVPPTSQPTPLSETVLDQIDALLDQGEAALNQGQAVQAEAAFQAVLRLDPQQFDALHMLGVVAMQRRDMAQCIALISQAIEVDPDFAMAHANLGIAWLESQQPERAVPCFERALALEPHFLEAHYGLGTALLALQQWDRALPHFDQVLAQQPGHAEAHFSRGNALLAQQRFKDALSSYKQALALQPGHVPALINRAQAELGLQQHANALLHCDQAIALQPDRAAAHAARGDALLGLHRHDEAVTAYDRSLALQPSQVPVLIHRGNALLHARRVAEAIASYRQAQQLAQPSAQPSAPLPAALHATLLANLGGALRDAGQTQEAVSACQQALGLVPDHTAAHMNHGNALLDLGQVRAARDAFAQTCALQPDHVDAQWALGWTASLGGDWQRGLPQLEWRWKKAATPPRAFSQPLWRGDSALAGRTILLHAEQGLGDTLQFCRYAPLLAAQGARVVLEVQPALKPLISRLHPQVQVVAQGVDPLPPFDCHCPLMSLPLAFNTTPDTVPAPPAYLQPEPQRMQAWGDHLGPRRGLRVGLIWSGNTAHRDDHNRSLPLATLLAVLPQGPEYVCLQKDIRDTDLPTLQANPQVRHLPEALQQFEDTAALTRHMDLVISVDTSMAHLSGALGQPTWILLPFMPDWRWLMDRPDTPWYPSARLFRQRQRGQWDAPLQDLAQALQALSL